MRLLAFSLAALCAAFVLPTQAAETDWTLAKDKDGVKVYTRLIEGSPLKEFRGITHIKTSVTSLVSLIDDPEACPDWMHNCREQEILERPNLKEKYSYNHVGAPWPVKDRDMVVHSYIEQDPETYRVHVKLNATQDYMAEKKGLVRITNMYGYWDFNPKADGIVEVTYQVFADPTGKIPTAIINSTVVDSPFVTLKNMQTKVLEDKYQTRVLESIKNPS